MAKKSPQKTWVGFDLGGTKMLAAVFDEKLRLLSRDKARTRAHEGVQPTLRCACELIESALEAAGARPRSLAGIGIGLPGALDLQHATVLDAPNLGWKNVPIGRMLSRKFKCPVVVVNDVDAGVYGEYAQGAARKARCVIGIFPGTGIGGGCVYEGRLLTGGSRSCMEIGHIPVVADGPLCGCGRRGCLESVANRLAIASAAAAAACRGAAPHLMENAGTNVNAIRSNAIAAAIKGGDAAVEQIVRHAAGMIGKAAAVCVNLMAPDVILLGGGLVEAMPDLYRSEVARAADATVMPPYRGTFKVVIAALGDDATATGAAAWAQCVIEGAAAAKTLTGKRARAKR